MSLVVTIIRDLTAFEEIADDWNELLSRSEVKNCVTLRAEWLICSVQSYLKGAPLFILTVWDDGRLVGGMPLRLNHTRVKKILPVKILQFIDSDLNPKKHILYPESNGQILENMLEILLKHKNEWDLLYLQGIRKKSDLLSKLKSYAKQHTMPIYSESIQESVYIDTTCSWEAYSQILSKNKRKGIRRALTRLGKAGEWRVNTIRTREEFESFYPAMLEVSKKSWKGQNRSDIGSISGDALFFQNFSLIAADRGWLLVWALELDGKDIVFQWQVRYKNSTTSFRTDFDLDYKDLSPGTCLRVEVLKELFNTELLRYDLGGAEYGDKKSWGTESIYYENILIGHKGIVSKFIFSLKHGRIHRTKALVSRFISKIMI